MGWSSSAAYCPLSLDSDIFGRNDHSKKNIRCILDLDEYYYQADLAGSNFHSTSNAMQNISFSNSFDIIFPCLMNLLYSVPVFERRDEYNFLKYAFVQIIFHSILFCSFNGFSHL